MSGRRPILAGSIALGVAAAMLTGCSTSTPGASVSSARAQENVSQACAAASAYAAALTNFKQTLKPGVTVGQVDSARDQVVKTYDDLIKESQDVAKDQVDAVQKAQDNFARAVRAVPDDATLPQAADSLRDEAANVQAAVSDLQTAAKC